MPSENDPTTISAEDENLQQSNINTASPSNPSPEHSPNISFASVVNVTPSTSIDSPSKYLHEISPLPVTPPTSGRRKQSAEVFTESRYFEKVSLERGRQQCRRQALQH
ncbi:hypothetical protein C0J52_18229 [Blattella germanica]|nr:hypothetical protein C0J52_18229 [Blattella germanica]